ncbi:MAG: hypothetical protein H6Q04_3257, partial [Acidobacteria bacterium]|nr:hypothetical protein [Acidobacteriota bacterium]
FRYRFAPMAPDSDLRGIGRDLSSRFNKDCGSSGVLIGGGQLSASPF